MWVLKISLKMTSAEFKNRWWNVARNARLFRGVCAQKNARSSVRLMLRVARFGEPSVKKDKQIQSQLTIRTFVIKARTAPRRVSRTGCWGVDG
ncbi:hypothetical protein GCM10019059_44630 [Camelimonas fluminis]|nr:hypothetical protein GCM10019059_44630 [Camelimonas fluminis]